MNRASRVAELLVSLYSESLLANKLTIIVVYTVQTLFKQSIERTNTARSKVRMINDNVLFCASKA